jgi:ornithine cyclodeaminase
MKIITLKQIKDLLPSLDLIPAIEAGFVAYSAGQAVMPPVGELLLDKGEVHIKYGYLRQEEYYVIKIASGFYQNPELGLSSSNGLMLLFRQQTGECAGILLDEGYLTNVRTAAAGAIAAKYLAPKEVGCIGIVGTGIQARLQLLYLKEVTACRQVLVWGRSNAKLKKYQQDMEAEGFTVETTLKAAEVLHTCRLVVTATPSTEPLLFAHDLQESTHITAVGADTPHKQELDPAILKQADLVVADSIKQCLERGEIHKAIQSKSITQDKPVELGHLIAGNIPGRISQDQITIADLTGVAVQDIKITAAVYEALK